MPATPRLNCSFTEPRCTCRGPGLPPPPTKPRPAGVWTLFDLPEAASPQPAGGGLGRGGAEDAPTLRHTATPSRLLARAAAYSTCGGGLGGAERASMKLVACRLPSPRR